MKYRIQVSYNLLIYINFAEALKKDLELKIEACTSLADFLNHLIVLLTSNTNYLQALFSIMNKRDARAFLDPADNLLNYLDRLGNSGVGDRGGRHPIKHVVRIIFSQKIYQQCLTLSSIRKNWFFLVIKDYKLNDTIS